MTGSFVLLVCGSTMPRGGLEVSKGAPKTSKLFQMPLTQPTFRRLPLAYEAQLRSVHSRPCSARPHARWAACTCQPQGDRVACRALAGAGRGDRKGRPDGRGMA